MKKARYGLWVVIILVIIGMFIIYWLMNLGDDDSRKKSLAKCLTEKEVKLYVNTGCPACRAQQADFGQAVEYLEIIVCSETPEICAEKWPAWIPAWEIPGQDGFIYGRQKLEKLAELSACPY